MWSPGNPYEVITNLKVLSKLKSGEKLCVWNQKLHTDPPTKIDIMRSLQRMSAGQGRKMTMEFISKLMQDVLSHLEGDIFNDQLEKDVCRDLANAIDMGLENLKQTYKDDNTICAEIDTLQGMMRSSFFYGVGKNLPKTYSSDVNLWSNNNRTSTSAVGKYQNETSSSPMQINTSNNTTNNIDRNVDGSQNNNNSSTISSYSPSFFEFLKHSPRFALPSFGNNIKVDETSQNIAVSPDNNNKHPKVERDDILSEENFKNNIIDDHDINDSTHNDIEVSGVNDDSRNETKTLSNKEVPNKQGANNNNQKPNNKKKKH